MPTICYQNPGELRKTWWKEVPAVRQKAWTKTSEQSWSLGREILVNTHTNLPAPTSTPNVCLAWQMQRPSTDNKRERVGLRRVNMLNKHIEFSVRTSLHIQHGFKSFRLYTVFKGQYKCTFTSQKIMRFLSPNKHPQAMVRVQQTSRMCW